MDKDDLKYLYALDIAVAEGFEWDYANAPEWDLIEAVEALGYVWLNDERRWAGPEEEDDDDEL